MPLAEPDLSAIAFAIESSAPDLAPVRPVHVLGQGFSSDAILTASGAVVRIARRAAVRERHEREMRLLPRIRPYLPASVPDPGWLLPPCEVMPFGAIAYIHIDGEVPGPVDHTATVAQQLGEFLQALWQVPPETYSGLGLPIVADPFIGLRALRDATMPGVARHLEPIELATVERWWAEVLADRWLAMPFRPTLVHGDLWWGNLLVRGEHPHLAAILDWESVHLGDIARDIATQMHAGVEFARTVVRHTGLGMESIILRARAQRYWEAREFEGISWSIEQGDDDELAESIAKLRAGPILNPGAPGLASLPGHAGVDSQHGAC